MDLNGDEVSDKVGHAESPDENRWSEFFARMRAIEVPKDFMIDRPMNQLPLEREWLVPGTVPTMEAQKKG